MAVKYYKDDEFINLLRRRRELECFSVINRGKAWYDLLTLDQESELKQWYEDWLNVTETKVIPIRPNWLYDKLTQGGDIL